MDEKGPEARKRHARTGRPRLEEAAAIDQRLVDTAIHMFLRHGPQVAMNAIVKESGLSRKTVYARYPNKSALFVGMLRHLLDAAAVTPAGIIDLESVEDSLYPFIRQSLFEICRPEAAALRRLLMLHPEYVEQVRADIENTIISRYMDPMRAYLRVLGQRSDVRAMDIEMTARTLMNAILCEMQGPAFQEQDVPVERLESHARHLARLFSWGIACRPTMEQ